MLDEIVIFVLIIVFSIFAIFSRRLLFAAVCLGLGSALLALVFFKLDAPFAGGFELSIGSGLISLLFIMAISLIERKEEEE